MSKEKPLKHHNLKHRNNNKHNNNNNNKGKKLIEPEDFLIWGSTKVFEDLRTPEDFKRSTYTNKRINFDKRRVENNIIKNIKGKRAILPTDFYFLTRLPHFRRRDKTPSGRRYKTYILTSKNTYEVFERQLIPGKTLAKFNAEISNGDIIYKIKTVNINTDTSEKSYKGVAHRKQMKIPDQQIMMFIGFIEEENVDFGIDVIKEPIKHSQYSIETKTRVGRSVFPLSENFVTYKEFTKNNSKKEFIKYQRWLVGKKVIDYQFLKEELTLLNN